MVNFLDTATVADLTSPEGISRFHEFLAVLDKRPARAFKCLHVYQHTDGYHAVDFAITEKTLDDIAAKCQAKLISISPDDPIPVQPESLWWEFWRRPLVKTYMHFPMKTYRRNSAFCVIKSL